MGVRIHPCHSHVSPGTGTQYSRNDPARLTPSLGLGVLDVVTTDVVGSEVTFDIDSSPSQTTWSGLSPLSPQDTEVAQQERESERHREDKSRLQSSSHPHGAEVGAAERLFLHRWRVFVRQETTGLEAQMNDPES